MTGAEIHNGSFRVPSSLGGWSVRTATAMREPLELGIVWPKSDTVASTSRNGMKLDRTVMTSFHRKSLLLSCVTFVAFLRIFCIVRYRNTPLKPYAVVGD